MRKVKVGIHVVVISVCGWATQAWPQEPTAAAPTALVSAAPVSESRVPLQGPTDPADAKVPAVTHNSWSKGTVMPTALKFTMTGLIAGKVYVVGGVSNTAVVSKNQVYNPVTNTWSSKAALPVATCDAASAMVKNVLYVFGGSNDGVTVTNAVWAYNPMTNKWSAKFPMPTARASVGAAVENNIIYVIGGPDGHSRLNTVESYNPATDTWTEEAPLIVGKSEPSVGLVGKTIVAADGVELAFRSLQSAAAQKWRGGSILHADYRVDSTRDMFLSRLEWNFALRYSNL